MPSQAVPVSDALTNATFRTRLQQCAGDWWPLSPRRSRVVHAAPFATDTEICVELRYGEGALERLAPLVSELMALKPDVLFTGGKAGTLDDMMAQSSHHIDLAPFPRWHEC